MNIRLPIFGTVTIGSMVAAFCSWSSNHSILYAVVHAFLSWFYVIYWLIAK